MTQAEADEQSRREVELSQEEDLLILIRDTVTRLECLSDRLEIYVDKRKDKGGGDTP